MIVCLAWFSLMTRESEIGMKSSAPGDTRGAGTFFTPCILVPNFYLCQLSLNALGMAAAKTYGPSDSSAATTEMAQDDDYEEGDVHQHAGLSRRVCQPLLRTSRGVSGKAVPVGLCVNVVGWPMST
jgi:hypothetical protein